MIPATGHDYVDGTCADCGEADSDYVPETTEPEVIVPAKPVLNLGKWLEKISKWFGGCFWKP